MTKPGVRQVSGRSPATSRGVAGVTLVEMVITLVIAAVLFALAVPSFRTMVISNRLTTTANEIVDVIRTARMEAVKRNGSVQVCSNSAAANGSGLLGEKCGVELGAVYATTIDSDGNTQPERVRGGMDGIDLPLKISGDFVALRFNAQGLGAKPGSSTPYNNQVVDICTASLSADNHRIIRMTAGSILQVDTATGTCT